jgi:hypothetical protein
MVDMAFKDNIEQIEDKGQLKNGFKKQGSHSNL